MPSPEQSQHKSARRRRYFRGHAAEFIAAAYLTLHGYRVIKRRFQTPVGEVDIIAVKRRCVIFVEVKYRQTMSQAEASITDNVRHRVRRAASLWLGKNSKYQGYDVGFDLIFLTPWHRPHHLKNAL